MVQYRDDSDSDQDHGSGNGQSGSVPGYILSVQPTGFPDGLVVGYEKTKNVSRVFHLSK